MIRAAIYGYGNLGQALCRALRAAPDFILQGIYTHRTQTLSAQQPLPFFDAQQIFSADVQVVFNCGGSATQLPRTTPVLAQHFCVVDSFDDHGRIPAHFVAVDASARAASTLCVISAGWDPGLFSLFRILGDAFLPGCTPVTLWGPGVSQGHSDALRRLPDVQDAREYTVPLPEARRAARQGRPVSAAAGHRRICYVVPRPGADLPQLENTIRTLPGYFAGYDTEIHFISQQQLDARHTALPHGGEVIAASPALPGRGTDGLQLMELQLSLQSNPAFTAGILLGCGRAAVRLWQRGETGCRTMADLPPTLYAAEDGAVLRARYL